MTTTRNRAAVLDRIIRRYDEQTARAREKARVDLNTHGFPSDVEKARRLLAALEQTFRLEPMELAEILAESQRWKRPKSLKETA